MNMGRDYYKAMNASLDMRSSGWRYRVIMSYQYGQPYRNGDRLPKVERRVVRPKARKRALRMRRAIARSFWSKDGGISFKEWYNELCLYAQAKDCPFIIAHDDPDSYEEFYDDNVSVADMFDEECWASV